MDKLTIEERLARVERVLDRVRNAKMAQGYVLDAELFDLDNEKTYLFAPPPF